MAKVKDGRDPDTVRRAVKARQQAVRRGGNKNHNQSFTFDALRKAQRDDRIRESRREAAIAAGKRNGDALLQQVIEKGSFTISVQNGDWDKFERDIRDVKSAAKRHPKRFVWEMADHGWFIIAVPKDNKAA